MRITMRMATTLALVGAVMAVGFLGACSLTGQGDSKTEEPKVTAADGEAVNDAKADDAEGKADDKTDNKSDQADDTKGATMGTQQLEADGIVAYVAQVGYKDGCGYDTVTISDRKGWDEFDSAMADVYYDSDGKAVVTSSTALREYDEEFFADGSKLLVRYMDLGSSGYNPKITGMHVDGDTATVSCDLGRMSGMMFTTDMSGFVTILEVPADSGVTDMNVIVD